MNFNRFTTLFRRKSSRRDLDLDADSSHQDLTKETSISISTPSLRISSAPSARGSMRSRLDKASTPPPSPPPPPRPLRPPPPPKPFDYDRIRASADSPHPKMATGEQASQPIRIEVKRSLDAGEMALSCPSMLPTAAPQSAACRASAVNPVPAQPKPSPAAVLRTNCPYLLENGLDGQAATPRSSTHIQSFLPPSVDGASFSCCACAREVELLRNETRILRTELTESRKTISHMKEKEKLLRHRLSEQARRQLERGSTKFEDISLGENRPSQLIRRYGNLYSEGRLEAMDALDELQEVTEFNDLKEKLLLSVIVLAFRNSRKNLEETKLQLRNLLHISDLSSSSSSPANDPNSVAQRSRPLPHSHPAVVELDSILSVFLRKTVDHQNLSRICQEVRDRVCATLYDFPKLRFCRGLQRYIEESVRLAWVLTIQNPSFVVDYKAKVFSPEVHTRFHTSDPESVQIRCILWPALREGAEHGPCVYRGVVVT